jgi:PAS domain S-box-containing protein
MTNRRDHCSSVARLSSLPELMILMAVLQIAIVVIVHNGLGQDHTSGSGLWLLALIGSTVLTLLLVLPQLRRAQRALEALVADRTAELINANAQLAQEIEERKQTEAILRQREATLEKVQNLAHIGDWDADFATNTITWSEELYRIHGRDLSLPSPTPEESSHYIHPDDREIHQTQMVAKVFAGQPFATDIRIVRANGEVRFVEARGEPIFDEAGQMVRYIGMSRDLTERKLTEDKLRKSEALLREAQATANLGCWEHDLLTNRTIWTEELYRIHGLDPELPPPTGEELIQQVIYPEDLPFYREHLVHHFESGQPFACDFRIMHANQEIRWVTAKGEPIFNQQGEIVRYGGIVMDISDRKAAEEKLRQSEATNRALVQAIPDLLIRLHRDGTYLDIRYGNNVRVFNFGKAQIDRHIQDIFPLETANAMLQTIQEVLDTQQIRVEEQRIVFNQSTYYEETRIVPCDDDEVLIIVRDVTDRKHGELELQNAKEVAEAANRAKSTFLSSMSHELRTPLNAILGFAQLLNRDTNLTAQQRQYINTINRNGQHLLELINDVLEVSKIESGKVSFHPTQVDLHQLLDNLHDLFQIKANAKNLTLTFERSPTVPPFILTDEGKLRQILTNLLSNAIKFTDIGSVQLRVRSQEPERVGEWESESVRDRDVPSTLIPSPPHPLPPSSLTLSFEVQDTGPGIAPEERAQLFKSFSQTTTGQQASEGTGLGLVISRSFVELMQGDIGVNSTPGVGSTFWFTLPVEVVKGDRIEKPLPNRKVIGLRSDQPRYRILVIEDHAENAQFLTELLSLVGFEVQQAPHGKAGLGLWETWAPHLILMDMQMPVMDGYATTRQIRERESGGVGDWERGRLGEGESERGEAQENPHTLIPSHPHTLASSHSQIRTPAHPHTKIIAVTGSAFEEDRTQILAAGCNDFIRKPFPENLLFERLAHHLGVQYCYAESELPVMDQTTPQLMLSTAALTVMPADWIHQLHGAAQECSQPLVLQLLQQIPPEHGALARSINQLATDFRFEDIVALTRLE